MGFLKDFKAFAMRGNVIDLAVGVVVGGAFGQIVNSLVADIIMPPVGILVGGVDFTDLAFILKKATADPPAVSIKYGAFLQTCINFLIIAFSIFLFVRLLSKLERKKDQTPTTVPPTKDQELLGEIRDLLKTQNRDLENK
ncbi:MAG: large-conductance mechanosensitive channel protein MscL [Rikenellaceae bacterium]|nr:large-conductance mechanosensitive channel protein MscL [Rikenellaceae bacterium]